VAIVVGFMVSRVEVVFIPVVAPSATGLPGFVLQRNPPQIPHLTGQIRRDAVLRVSVKAEMSRQILPSNATAGNFCPAKSPKRGESADLLAVIYGLALSLNRFVVATIP
jgi:hypothetical protein